MAQMAKKKGKLRAQFRKHHQAPDRRGPNGRLAPLAPGGRGLDRAAVGRGPHAGRAFLWSVAVFGVAMLNGIVLVEFINHLRDEGRGLRDAIREGVLLRLRPVLITASIAMFGLTLGALDVYRGDKEAQKKNLGKMLGDSSLWFGLLTVVIIGGVLFFMLRRDRNKSLTPNLG